MFSAATRNKKQIASAAEIAVWAGLFGFLSTGYGESSRLGLLFCFAALAGFQVWKHFGAEQREQSAKEKQNDLLELAGQIKKITPMLANDSETHNQRRGENQKILLAAIETVKSIGEQVRASGAEANRALNQANNLTESQAQRALETIGSFNNAVLAMTASQNRLETINEVIQQIAQKIRVVDDVVFKTSLLSFNASIEAARAGQYGRGFSVVASEISKLADSTSVASKDIGQLLQRSLGEVDSIVRVSVENSKVTEQIGIQFAETFQSLLSGLEDVTPVMSSLTKSAVQQGLSCEEALRAVQSLDERLKQEDESDRGLSDTAQALKHYQAELHQRLAS